LVDIKFRRPAMEKENTEVKSKPNRNYVDITFWLAHA
jgi:hypothetical protein